MHIDSDALKYKLIEIKGLLSQQLDRANKNQVRSVLISNIGMVEQFLIWVSIQEKQGEVNMDLLKLGELVRWEPKSRKGSIDSLIIEESKKLRKNFDAIKVTVDTVKWNTLSNRTYKLREDNKIPQNIVPRKDENGVAYLVYLDNPGAPRGRK